MIDPSGNDFWSAAGAFGTGFVYGVGGTIVVAALVATGTVVGTVAAVAIVGYGAFELGASLTEAVLGHDMGGNVIAGSDRVDMAAGAAGGLVGGAVGGWGYGVGREFKLPIDALRGPTGKPARVAPWGNRTGHPVGEYPHYHRAISDPNCPGASLRGQGIGNHRPWEGGF